MGSARLIFLKVLSECYQSAARVLQQALTKQEQSHNRAVKGDFGHIQAAGSDDQKGMAGVRSLITYTQSQ